MTAEVIPHDHSAPITLEYLVSQSTGDVVLLSTTDGHISPGGTSATLAAGAQSTTVAALTACKDAAGSVRATSIGSANAAGALVTITFATAYEATPKAVTLGARTAATAALGLYVSALSTTAMTISCGSAPAASTVYDFSYQVAG